MPRFNRFGGYPSGTLHFYTDAELLDLLGLGPVPREVLVEDWYYPGRTRDPRAWNDPSPPLRPPTREEREETDRLLSPYWTNPKPSKPNRGAGQGRKKKSFDR